ncbi:MAG: YwiC-like family protein, partial [Rudaea sp.]
MSVSEMTRSFRSATKQYVLPAEHGGWFLWIGPFLLGALAAEHYTFDLLWLLLLIVAVYLSRQPLIIIVKALTGRRARAEAVPAVKAFAAIAAVGAALFAVLLLRGHWGLTLLALPAGPVLAAQLWLVSQRKERQIGIELFGSGVLALSATAAYWVSVGSTDSTGWWLWLLSWLYNASAIVYVYTRLVQRRWNLVPPWSVRWQNGIRTLLYAGFNLALTFVLAAAGLLPGFVVVAYAFALLHFAYGIAFPCVHARPTRVGIEQSLATL